MRKLYEPSQLWFFLLWAFLYILGQQLGSALSQPFGSEWACKAFINLGLSLFLCFRLRRQGLLDRWGLGKLQLSTGQLLRLVPLVILSSFNLWQGIGFTMPVRETLFYMVGMACAGFLEELLIRGLLFAYLRQRSLKTAVCVTTLVFGLAHILNLFSGSGMSLTDNLLQVGSALCVGLLYAAILIRSGSLWPCIFSHAAINILSAFARQDGSSPLLILIHMVCTLLYALMLLKPIQKQKS